MPFFLKDLDPAQRAAAVLGYLVVVLLQLVPQ